MSKNQTDGSQWVSTLRTQSKSIVPNKRALMREYDASKGHICKIWVREQTCDFGTIRQTNNTQLRCWKMKIVERKKDNDDGNTQELNVGLQNGVGFEVSNPFRCSFSRSCISCGALKFKLKQMIHSMILKNHLNHLKARLAENLQSQTQENSKLAPYETLCYVQLIKFEPQRLGITKRA